MLILSFCWHFWLIFIPANLSVILIFFPVAEETTQFSDQIRIRLISQLIKDNSRVLQTLLKYFNGTAISTVDLNDSEFVIAVLSASVADCLTWSLVVFTA